MECKDWKTKLYFHLFYKPIKKLIPGSPSWLKSRQFFHTMLCSPWCVLHTKRLVNGRFPFQKQKLINNSTNHHMLLTWKKAGERRTQTNKSLNAILQHAGLSLPVWVCWGEHCSITGVTGGCHLLYTAKSDSNMSETISTSVSSEIWSVKNNSNKCFSSPCM